MTAADITADVLVIGAGLAGSAAAIQLAAGGAKVALVESRPLPRGPSARGGLLFSRGVQTLNELGVDTERLGRSVSQLRLVGANTVTRPLPTLASHTNRVIDQGALKSAVRQRLMSSLDSGGGDLWVGWSATTPLVERGFLRGAIATAADGARHRLRADYTVIADGANSTFGRALGTYRRRTWPFAVSTGAIWASPHSDDDQIELALDLTDRAGTPITGFGWVLPRGDGTVGVGVTVLSTAPSFQALAPDRLLASFVDRCRRRWDLGTSPSDVTAEGRLPLGNSITPISGPTFVVAGDAGGFGNPLVGTGADTALSSGVAAAAVIGRALADGASAPLQQYAQAVNERTAGYYKVGRLGARLLGRPSLMRQLGDLVTRSPAAADILIKIATGELHSRRLGAAELVYRATRTLSIFAPEA